MTGMLRGVLLGSTGCGRFVSGSFFSVVCHGTAGGVRVMGVPWRQCNAEVGGICNG